MAFAPQKYPIGIQTFSKIIEDGYVYVDKTSYLVSLLRNEGYYFLSRPRRFGKSLLLSTFQAYFEGRRDLFKGLALDKADVDWTPSPVINLDFNPGVYNNPNGLTSRLNSTLTSYEEKYGIVNGSTAPEDIPMRFEKLISVMFQQTGRRVVILIDEYDKPLLGLEEDEELFQKNQSLLKGFLGNLKSMDAYIRFVFLTGVARFNKVSIFSDLNNLNDISLVDEFAGICGWTEEEMTENLLPGITQLAARLKKSMEETISTLRNYYDGYRFTSESLHIYNPFSVLNALFAQSIRPYWFSTGTPTFLVRKIKRNNIFIGSLGYQWCSENDLMSPGLNSRNPLPLLFQTGYLTIQDYDDETRRYKLGFPNYEVEHGFHTQLLKLYLPQSDEPDSPFCLNLFQIDLVEGKPESFMTRLGSLLKDMPFESHEEKTYQNLIYLICKLSGSEAQLERHSYIGRSDLEVYTKRFIYIFEFKYNGSVKNAMLQIHARDYAGRHRLDSRTIFLIGANFSVKPPFRGLTGYEIEKI